MPQRWGRSDLVLMRGTGDITGDEAALDCLYLLLDVVGHGKVLNGELVCVSVNVRSIRSEQKNRG